MKIYITTLIILVCCLLFSAKSTAQIDKKSIKEIELKITTAHTNTNYNEVIEQAQKAATSKVILSDEAFSSWVSAVVKYHKLNNAFYLLEYYNENIFGTRTDKKIDPLLKKEIVTIKKLREAFNKEIRNLKNDEFKELNTLSLLNCVRISSNYFEPYYYLGHITFISLQFDSSITYNSKALEFEPEMQELIIKKAISHYNLKDFKNAITFLNKIENHPFPSEIDALKANCYLNLNQLEQAIVYAEKALPKVTNKQEVLEILKDAEFRKGNMIGVVNALYNMLESEERLYTLTNEAHLFASDYFGDSIALKKAKLQSQKFPKSPNFLVLQLMHLDKQDFNYDKKIIALYDKLIILYPNQTFYYRQKGLVLYNSEHSKEQRLLTKAVFDKVIALDSFDYDSYEYICRTYLWHDSKISKQYKKLALNNMYSKLESDPTSGDANFNIAKAYNLPTNGYGNNNLFNDSMLKYLNLALKYDVDSINVLFERRYIYDSKSEWETANIDHSWVSENTKSNNVRRMCLYNLAGNYKRLKQFEKARATILILQKENPNDRHTKTWLRDIEKELKK
jgi:hypothetical protein